MKATRLITTGFIALASLAANAQEGAWNGELNTVVMILVAFIIVFINCMY